MKIAFVDLLFSWPPNGGADVDLYHTVQELQRLGHEVRVFVAGYEKNWERGNVDVDAMPFPVTLLEFTTLSLNGPSMGQRFREAVDAWRPEAVFLGDGFFLKPWVIDALAHYPIAARFYAYEIPCIRDLLLFKNGAPCPNNYLRTPDECRTCAAAGMKDVIRRWRLLTWQHEFLVSGAFLPGYHQRLVESLRKVWCAIVYNELQRSHLAGVIDNVHIVPGGVNASDYSYTPPTVRANSDKKVIFMAGRTEDPMKGLTVLLEAGEKLAKHRSDFMIQATHTDHTLNREWFAAVGWHSHVGVKRFYQESDICVVPSVWEEPFGLVAVEAMASGRPVCASRVGGLQTIVEDGRTGFVFDRGDSGALAAALERLLDDAALRDEMGRAGRARVEERYDWARVVEAHYPAILEVLAQ